jgi:acyl-CoA thioester hydrolase
MPRIKIELPEKFLFSTTLPVRITDLNYGGHVGNDSILSMIHEGRIRFLSYHGFSELNFGGLGLIMSDVSIEFKAELFYSETVIISVAATGFSKVGFEIYYKLEKETAGKRILVAMAKTGMVCYDYEKKKVSMIPEDAREKFAY